MDIGLFVPGAPGELVQIGEGELAFVPHALPPNWEYPARLWPLLSEAMQQIGILEGVGRNLPNPGILIRPLEDREAM